ncbi:MAG: protein phosphatase 2C domain-containing protein [Desulfobacterales bacterium]|jgi:protein phosphatase
MVVVESAGITDVGKRRKGNEDALFMDDDSGLYIVSDGMGGHRAGEVASAMVIETISDFMAGTAGGNPPGASQAGGDSLSPRASRLMAAILQANRKVYEAAQSRESYRGMGATVSAAVLTDETLIAANVGDSPIYLIHAGAIELLSVTHNVVSEQAALNPAAADRLGEDVKYLLTRAMGVEEIVEPDICEIPFFRGDAVVISSDGLSDLVSPEEIMEVVSSLPAARACRKLVEMANQRAGHDNITVIILNVKDVKRQGLLGRLLSKFFR